MKVEKSDIFSLLDQIIASADASFVTGVVAGILITIFVYTYIGKFIVKFLGLTVAVILATSIFNFVAPEVLRDLLSPAIDLLFDSVNTESLLPENSEEE